MNKQQGMARQLCKGALTVASWLVADQLVKAFGCSGCRSLGYPPPVTLDTPKPAAKSKPRGKRTHER